MSAPCRVEPRASLAQPNTAREVGLSHRLLLIGGGMLVAGSALAQNPASTPPVPGDAVPGEFAADAGPSPAQNLREKLNRSDGVINPKEVDPAIEKRAPLTQDPNVVPQPGAAGGDSAPKPKCTPTGAIGYLLKQLSQSHRDLF